MQMLASLLRETTFFVLCLIGNEWVEPSTFGSSSVWTGMSQKMH